MARSSRSGCASGSTAPIDLGALVQPTVSIGIAQLEPEESEPDSLLKRADKALYKAKTGGRNCTVVARRGETAA